MDLEASRQRLRKSVINSRLTQCASRPDCEIVMRILSAKEIDIATVSMSRIFATADRVRAGNGAGVRL